MKNLKLMLLLLDSYRENNIRWFSMEPIVELAEAP